MNKFIRKLITFLICFGCVLLGWEIGDFLSTVSSKQTPSVYYLDCKVLETTEVNVILECVRLDSEEQVVPFSVSEK